LKLLAPYLGDVRPYLADLLGADVAVQCHLVQFCSELGELFALDPPRWPYAPAAAQAVLDWFMEDRVLVHLRAAWHTFQVSEPQESVYYAWVPYALDDLLGVATASP
jgi:hypothetical protein